MTAPQPAHGRNIAVGVARIAVARIASLGLSFVGWAIVARALGPSPLGTLQFVIALFSYVAYVGDPGLTTLGTREFVQSSRPYAIVSTILGARLLLAALATVGVVALSWVLDVPEAERLAVAILASGQLALAVNLKWVLRSQQRSAALAMIEASQAVAFAGLAVLIVHGPDSLIPAAVAVVAGPWVEAVLSLAFAMGRRWRWPTLTREAFTTVRRALPLGVATFSIAIYYGADTVLLGLYRSTAEVGWYGSAYRLVLPWLQLASIVGWLAMPKIAEMYARERSEVPQLLSGLSRAMLLVAMPLAVSTMAFAPHIVTLAFGDSFAESALPLSMLIWSTVTVYGNAPFGFLMLARRQDRRYMLIGIAGAFVNIVTNLVAIPTFGMVGAAMTTLTTELLVFGAIIWATRDMALPPLLTALRYAIPVSAATGLVAFATRESLWGVPVTLAIYAAALIATSAVPIGSIRAFARSWVRSD